MKPNIKAKFILDKNGDPVVIDEDSYEIEISVENTPENAYSVLYRLDESYYNPIREVSSKSANFIESLTSYGDYIISARVKTKTFPIEIKKTLYQALFESHKNDQNQKIRKALQDIKDN